MTTETLNKTERRIIAQAHEKGYVVAVSREKRVPLLKLATKGLMIETEPGTFRLTKRTREESCT